MIVLPVLPGSLAEPREVGFVDLGVSSGSISMSPSHPSVGEVVRVTAMVANTGTLTATADVYFYDGKPPLGVLIGNNQVSLGPESVQPVSIQWNTNAHGSGFHDLWVTANPIEYPDTNLANNNASREMTLSGVYSWVTSEKAESFTEMRALSDIMGIWNIGRLTVEGALINFIQERDYQFGIVVDEQGVLSLRDTQIISNYALRILVEGNGQLVIEPGCAINGMIITRDRGQVTIDNSTITGGTGILGGNITVTNSALDGVFSFQSTNASFRDVVVTTNQTIRVGSSILTAVDTRFELAGGAEQATLDTLNVSGSSMVKFTGVVSGTIKVAGTSMVLIYRYLTMHAEDNTGLAIPYATLWLRHLFKIDPAQCQTTNKLGDASFKVLTDVLQQGTSGTSAKAVGSYNVTGMMSNVQAQTNIQLPYYPTMTAESNLVTRTIVFEPIFYQNGHDPWNITTPKVLGDLNSPGAYSHSGDIYVWTNFTLYNIPLVIEQPSDFWAGVYVYPTGRINFIGGGITSNHRLNVYIIGSGQMTIEPTVVMNGILNINSLVGLEDESGAKGRFSARNIEFNGSIMGTLADVRFSVSSILPHPYNTINGALAFGIDNADIGNTTVTAPPPAGKASRILVGQSLKFTNCALNIPRLATNGNVVSFSNCHLSGRYTSGLGTTSAESILNLSATTLSIIECTLDYEQIILAAQSFISTSTDYPIPLIFDGSSTGSLTDVDAPAIIVNDSAEVEVKWLFTLNVLDAFGTPVEGAEVSVRNYTNNMTISGGQQTTAANGKVVFLLLGKKVYANEVIFLGNYKVIVAKRTAGGETAEYGPYDISMRTNVNLTVLMDRYMNPLERLLVHIDNLSRYSNLSEGDEVSTYGHAWKMHKGGYTELAANFPVTLTLSNSGVQYNGTTDGNGFFNITFRAPSPSERNITVTVMASEEGAETGSDSLFNLSVPMPRPDSLRIGIGGFDHTPPRYIRNKETVTIFGNVEFSRKGVSIGVAANATVRISVSPGVHNFEARTDATGSFSVPIGKYSTVTTYYVTISAIYVQGNLSVQAQPAAASFNVRKEATTGAQAPIPVWLIAVVILVVVAMVGVAAFFVLRMQSEAAKLVECGECGAFIPESAQKCPKCQTEFETEVVKCSECGSWIPPNVTECPKCNAQFKRKATGPRPPAPGAPGAPARPGAPGAPAKPGAPPPPPPPPPAPPR